MIKVGKDYPLLKRYARLGLQNLEKQGKVASIGIDDIKLIVENLRRLPDFSGLEDKDIAKLEKELQENYVVEQQECVVIKNGAYMV